MKTLKCKNCGELWGYHYHQYCYHWDSGELFCPEGMKLTDLCALCGRSLSEHDKHMYCDKHENTIFELEHTLSDELFEI